MDSRAVRYHYQRTLRHPFFVSRQFRVSSQTGTPFFAALFSAITWQSLWSLSKSRCDFVEWVYLAAHPVSCMVKKTIITIIGFMKDIFSMSVILTRYGEKLKPIMFL